MTTIVFHANEFGWDTQTTWQGRGMTGKDKVFTNGPVTFGVAGAARMGDILRHMDIPALRDYEPDFDLRKWIVRDLVPAILEEAKKVNAAEVLNSQADIESSVIFHAKGVVGYLSGNLSFVEDESGYYGVGSGADYALGALRSGASVKEAVETAIFFDLYSGGEARVLEVSK